jgi:hypothetical protein
MAPGAAPRFPSASRPTTATFQSVAVGEQRPHILSFASGAPMGTRTAAKG